MRKFTRPALTTHASRPVTVLTGCLLKTEKNNVVLKALWNRKFALPCMRIDQTGYDFGGSGARGAAIGKMSLPRAHPAFGVSISTSERSSLGDAFRLGGPVRARRNAA